MASLIVTVITPDIVIVDQKIKSVHIFELTVPGEFWMEIAHTLKSDSYSHFVNELTLFL